MIGAGAGSWAGSCGAAKCIHTHTAASTAACLQGAWSIGLFKGSSPFTLEPLERAEPPAQTGAAWPVVNPVLTCASVADAPSSFGAWPRRAWAATAPAAAPPWERGPPPLELPATHCAGPCAAAPCSGRPLPAPGPRWPLSLLRDQDDGQGEGRDWRRAQRRRRRLLPAPGRGALRALAPLLPLCL